jgi:malate synthase
VKNRVKKQRRPVMNPQKLNAEEILAKLAEIRSKIPPERLVPRKPRPETTSRVDARSVEDFEYAAVLEAVEGLADEVRSSVDAAREQAFEQALDIYYAAEELARDPEHANLIEQVEKMRQAYLSSYGHPIPSKEETEKRRKKS